MGSHGSRRWTAAVALLTVLTAAATAAATASAALAPSSSGARRLQAADPCASAKDVTLTRFRVEPVPVAAGAPAMCMRVSSNATCSGRCCAAEPAPRLKFSKLVFTSPSAACRAQAKKLRFSVDGGRAVRAKLDPNDGSLAVPLRALPAAGGLICADTEAVPDPSCKTLAHICGGGPHCELRLVTKAFKATIAETKRAACCAYARPAIEASPLITLINVGTNDTFDAVFQAAAARWERVITASFGTFLNKASLDLSRGLVPGRAWTGDTASVLVFYDPDPPGPGGFAVTEDPPSFRPLSGYIAAARWWFASDEAYLDRVTREMGRILGMNDATMTGKGCSKAQVRSAYTCRNANRQYAALCPNSTADLKINCWFFMCAWTYFPGELMSDLTQGGPMSAITIGAMEDVWGSVDYSKAEMSHVLCPGAANVSAASLLPAPGPVAAASPPPATPAAAGAPGQQAASRPGPGGPPVAFKSYRYSDLQLGGAPQHGP